MTALSLFIKQASGHHSKLTVTIVDDIEGFSIWYLNAQPSKDDLGAMFGFKPDFNGLGVFVFKHERKWRVLAIHN